MGWNVFTRTQVLLAALASAPLMFAGPLALPVSGGTLSNAKVEHVLLISVDGLHQQDLTTCFLAHTCPHIAQLASTGANYTGAFTPGLSDSVPGLAALVTGGSPKTTGLFYDDVYDRSLYSGTDTACTGTQGVEVFLQELVGIDAINGGALIHLDGGGGFNPQQLPRKKLKSGECVPVYPHDFIQTNTIFEVVRQNMPGAFTAFADKHAWGSDWLNGPSGSGVIDLARTEINSLVPGQSFDYTQSILTVQTFDNFHVQILLNQIDGKDSSNIVDPTKTSNQIPVPTLFGTNFQTLSVAQKALNTNGGGYTDAHFTPNTQVAQAMAYIDEAIGKITAALDAKKLTKSTLIILTAKHGQTPVDHSTLKKIGHTEATALAAFNIGTGSDPITGNVLGTGQITDDDVSFIWLNSQGDLTAALATLNSNKSCPTVDPIAKIINDPVNTTGICADNGGSVLSLASVPGKFGDPSNGRTPDIMIQPNSGVIYSKSATKDAEHGGFAPNDSNVGLLVSHPLLKPQTITSKVVTTQVAPTIIQALGLNPSLLNSVKVEGTEILPNLF